MTYDVIINGRKHRLQLDRVEGGWRCQLDGRALRIDAVIVRPDVLSLVAEGKAYEVKREQNATGMQLWIGPVHYSAEVRDPRSLRSRKGAGSDDRGPKELLASMPGKIVRVLVTENAEVEAGQGIVVVEAMKMQNEIKSPKKGVIQKVLATPGAAVNAGDVLAIVE